MAESTVHLNSALRERTALETETMLAYMNQTLELPYPPNFVKATMPVLQRAMVEQYHETHLEATLAADVDPRARLRKSMTHNTLFGMMYSANGDTARGRLMISRLMEDVKRLKFDGIHTLSFVFNSQRIAQFYQGFAFRLNGTCIELEDTTAGHDKGTYRQARLRRQYALRAYGVEDLGLVAFLAALSKLPGVRIVDAERPRLEATDIADSSYFLLRFQEEQCPAALQGVTKVFINRKVVTFHHHVVHQRMPCARCFAPFHTTGFCKANPTQLKRNQAKFQRTYKGPVPAFDVGEAIQYHHTDGDSLSNFLETLTRELTAVMNAVAETESAPEGASLETTGPIPDHAGHAGQPTVAAGRTGNAQGPVPARVTHSETTAATDADGFRTVVRRQAHTRHSDLDSKPELRQQTSEEKSDVRLAELTACNGATSHARGDHPDASVRANLDTYPSVGTRQRGQKSKAKAKQQAKPPAFAKFKKAMAMGKFALLHDDDSDDNADVSDDEPDEAPYAYEPAPLTPKEVVHEALGQYGALAEEDSEDEVDGSNKDAMSDIASDDDSQRHMDVQSAEGCHDDSVSRRDTTATYSPFPHKDETSARVTGQPNATTGQMGKETSAMVQTTLTSFVTSAGEVIDTLRTAASPVAHAENDFVPGSPDSQQEFTIGTTHRATPDGDHTEPIRVAQFLDSFDGYEVEVPANGQCAMLALYATISNNSTRTLKNTATTVKQAGVIKRGIYALMLANLRRDVEVGLLDPVTVYHDLYPDHPLFDSKEAANAALYAHYEQERDRPTNATVPSSFWAGPHELRAIAQYLREPLLVLDVDRTGIATMQRYTYKVHRLQNGEDHESGCYEAFSHSQARDYMYACWSLHVLPYFMVRHVSERHFYGVAHGDTFVKWRAEGDNEYAANVSSSNTWKGTVNYLRPEEDSDLESLNKLANLDNINSVIIKRLPMRERLDIVCARLGLPTLDAVGYDNEEDLERTIAAEGRILQEALGIDGYASGSQASQDGTGMDIVLPVRYPRVSSGEVVENAYFRLLRAPEGEEIDKEDYGQYKLFTAANAEAFSKWCSLYRSRLEIPATRRRSNPRTIAPWLLEHVGALRHLFAFLPYPELEAKQWASENLYQWGAVEAFREQSDAI